MLVPRCPPRLGHEQTQHKHYNKLLNNQAQAARHTPHPIKYQHLHETDIFRKVGNKKIRIRQDKKTQTVVQVCEKVRLGDLNVFCPMRKFDWRLSVSTETPRSSPFSLSFFSFRYRSKLTCGLCAASWTSVREVPQGPDLNVRSKDRLSYEHQVVQVDLTQVTTDVSPSFLSLPHERLCFLLVLPAAGFR